MLSSQLLRENVVKNPSLLHAQAPADVSGGWNGGNLELFFYLKSERIFEGGYSGLVRCKVYKFSMRSSNSGEGGNLKMFGHFISDLTQDTTSTIPELVWCVETYAEGYRLGVHFAGQKYF